MVILPARSCRGVACRRTANGIAWIERERVMKTKAAVLYERGQPRPYTTSRPLAVDELELDPPGDGEVLVKVRAAGICHSDLSVINADRPRPTPMAIGHEAAGEVVEVGAGVTKVRNGDHVVMVFVPSCGHCLPCVEGRPALCEPGAAANNEGTLITGSRRLHKGGQHIHHHVGVSAFAEYAVCSENSLIKIDRDLPFEEAALFGCAVLTGVGLAANTAKVAPGSTVAVVGVGGVGLNAMLGAELCGARKVVAIDLQDDKLQLAKQLGADDVFNAGDPDCIAKVREATSGGVDYALELAGSVKALRLAYDITRRGGTTATAGLANLNDELSIPAVGLVGEERTIKGSYLGSCVPLRDVPRYIELYRKGKLPVDRLMSQTIGFDEINLAFDRLADGRTVRQILVP